MIEDGPLELEEPVLLCSLTVQVDAGPSRTKPSADEARELIASEDRRGRFCLSVYLMDLQTREPVYSRRARGVDDHLRSEDGKEVKIELQQCNAKVEMKERKQSRRSSFKSLQLIESDFIHCKESLQVYYRPLRRCTHRSLRPSKPFPFPTSSKQ